MGKEGFFRFGAGTFFYSWCPAVKRPQVSPVDHALMLATQRKSNMGWTVFPSI